MRIRLFFLSSLILAIVFILSPAPAMAACTPPQTSKYIFLWQQCPSGCAPSSNPTAGLLERECCCSPQATGIPPTPTPGSSVPGSGTYWSGCPGTGYVNSALGCVPTENYTELAAWLLQRAIGISGGIAFLLMVLGGFRILISAGDPKAVQAGSEMISSALIGLLFIVFSLFLLELIGVKILGIPGL